MLLYKSFRLSKFLFIKSKMIVCGRFMVFLRLSYLLCPGKKMWGVSSRETAFEFQTHTYMWATYF